MTKEQLQEPRNNIGNDILYTMFLRTVRAALRQEDLFSMWKEGGYTQHSGSVSYTRIRSGFPFTDAHAARIVEWQCALDKLQHPLRDKSVEDSEQALLSWQG